MRNLFLTYVLITAVLLGLTVSLGGCGQKGDLYIPDKPQEFQR
jgi:predicted small lipoprotein YifL